MLMHVDITDLTQSANKLLLTTLSLNNLSDLPILAVCFPIIPTKHCAR